MIVRSFGTIARQNGRVRLFRGSFQPHTVARLNAETRIRAFARIASNLFSANCVERCGKSHAPPSSFSNSSFIATKFTFSQKPSGLSQAGGMRSDSGPKSIPQLRRRRATGRSAGTMCAGDADRRTLLWHFRYNRVAKKGFKNPLSTRIDQHLAAVSRILTVTTFIFFWRCQIAPPSLFLMRKNGAR